MIDYKSVLSEQVGGHIVLIDGIVIKLQFPDMFLSKCFDQHNTIGATSFLCFINEIAILVLLK